MTLGTPEEEALGLLRFIAASPTPYHACREAAERLAAVGFTEAQLESEWAAGERRFVVRGGTLIALWVPSGASPDQGVTVVGAHTDSPNLRLRPRPDLGRAGYRQLSVEVYGGALVNSWLDRDLGVSGRAVVRGPEGPETRLFQVDRPLARLPQLAIHLDREVNEKGVRLNRQTEVVPIWGLGEASDLDFAAFVAGEVGVGEEAVLAWDAMLHPLEAPALAGRGGEFVSAPRLDNLGSSYCGVRAMVEVAESRSARRPVVLALFDHEEVGSVSARGAGGALLPQVLEQLGLGMGGGRAEFLRSLGRTTVLSVDMAHAAHPNYLDHYEPAHLLQLNSGPAIKTNANQRYATDAETGGRFALACEDAGVPFQWYSSRGDMPCGSTIGPSLAARLGAATVDVGIPQLAMHSAREMAGSQDPSHLIRAMLAFIAT